MRERIAQLWIGVAAVVVLTWGARQADAFELVWPTPNRAFLEGAPMEDYLQPTASGRVESALFGCSRNGGRRFHEGVDLKAVARDSRGEAIDPVYAVMDGVVVYVNRTAWASGYGRYIVIEHPGVTPPILTLYAHLRSADEGLSAGDEVVTGQPIGIVGRSAGGYTIPRARAHLHFEMGVRISDDFQSWYEWRQFGSNNRHGVYNGMNLIGFDAMEFFSLYLAGEVRDFQEYFDRLAIAYTLRIVTERTPDFIERYPSLLDISLREDAIGGWDVDFTWFGLPVRWRPIPADAIGETNAERVRILTYDAELLGANACRQTVLLDRRQPRLGSGSDRILQLLFGLR